MSTEALKLSQEELQEIQSLNQEFVETKVKLADVVYNEKILIDRLDNLKQQFASVEQKLIQKYGDNATINLKDGTVTPPKEPNKEELQMSIIDKNTKVNITIKDFGAVFFFIASVLTVYFSLRADIAEAKELPPSEVTLQQFDYQVATTQENLTIIKEDIKEIKEVLHKLEERIYEIK